MRHHYSEEVEAREDGGLQFCQKLHRFLSKHFETPDKTSEQGLFVYVKQPLYSKEFKNSTKQRETKTEDFAHHPLNNSEIFCLQKLKDFKIRGSIGRSGEKSRFF